MKFKICVITFLFLMVPVMGMADEAADLQKRIMMDQKKLVVIKTMEFTDAEARKFWPVYDKYQEQLFQNNLKLAGLIVSYAVDYKDLGDDQALDIVDRHNAIQDERQTLLKRFDANLRQVLPGKKVFRYLQVENKLYTIARMEMVKAIPLAK